MSDIKLKQDHSEQKRKIVEGKLEMKKKLNIFCSQEIIENWNLAMERQEVT